MLAVTIAIIFPPLGGLPAEDRAELRRIVGETRVELRAAGNRLRAALRQAAPKRTRRLSRGIRVRQPRRSVGINSIAIQVIVPVFYAAATNAHGSSAGWFDDTVADRRNARRFEDVADTGYRRFFEAYGRALGNKALADLRRKLNRGGSPGLARAGVLARVSIRL